ncbi:MAG: hypothetical protein WC301_05790 [Candidatus Omnitrophota bacterium]|jgi:hypothetical protein
MKNKAQSVSEYSIFLSIILVALVVMNIYVKRGLQGRYKDMVDMATASSSAQGQYEPYYADSENIIDISRQASMDVGSQSLPEEGKVTKRLSDLAKPTTVESASIDGAAEAGTELEEGSRVLGVR